MTFLLKRRREEIETVKFFVRAVFLVGLIASAAVEVKAEDSAIRSVQPARLSSAAKKIIARLKKKGLSILPDALTALQSKTKQATSSASILEGYFFGAAVVGTPPTLASFDRQLGGAVSSFWRSGVVQSVAAGSPSAEQCGEFFNGPTDGQSGGFGACIMAEGVGRAFETAIDAGSSVCQMRNFSSKLKLNDPALTFRKGKNRVPGGDFRAIFNSGEKERFIKVRVLNDTSGGGNGSTPRNIFIRIPSIDSNAKRNFLYRAEVYFCLDSDATARGYNSIQVLNKGSLRLVNKDKRGDGSGDSTVVMNGRVTPAGSALKWELDSARSGEVRFSGTINGRLVDEKMGFSVSKDEVVLRRLRNREEGGVIKEYTVASILGDNALTLKFLAGAFKNAFGPDRTFVGATEFRAPIYVSAPSSDLRARVVDFDFAADPLYSGLSEVSIDLNRYSCSASPQISIEFDRSKVTDPSFDSCATNRLRRMNFCSGDPVIRTAANRQGTVCAPPPPPPG